MNTNNEHERIIHNYINVLNAYVEKTGIVPELSQEVKRDFVLKYLENPLEPNSLEFYGLASHQIHSPPDEELMNFFKSCYDEIKKLPEDRKKIILENFQYYYSNIFQMISDEEKQEIERRKKICNITEEVFENLIKISQYVFKKIPAHTYNSLSADTRYANFYDKKTKTFKLLKSKVLIFKKDFAITPFFQSNSIEIDKKAIRDYLLNVNSKYVRDGQGKKNFERLASSNQNLLLIIPEDLSQKARVEFVNCKNQLDDFESVEKILQKKVYSKSARTVIYTRSIKRIIVDFFHARFLDIFQKIKQILKSLSPRKKL